MIPEKAVKYGKPVFYPLCPTLTRHEIKEALSSHAIGIVNKGRTRRTMLFKVQLPLLVVRDSSPPSFPIPSFATLVDIDGSVHLTHPSDAICF